MPREIKKNNVSLVYFRIGVLTCHFRASLNTKTRYNNQVMGKYRVDPQRAGLTLKAELTWSNLGLKEV